MKLHALSDLLAEQIENMPPQLKAAARFVLSHPEDVALTSMREQARIAGVSHSTMVRLANWVGFDGYDDLRAVYAKMLRDTNPPSTKRRFSTKPVVKIGSFADMLGAEAVELSVNGGLRQHATAASIISGARRLLSVGSRAELLVANHFTNVLTSLGKSAILLDAEDARSASPFQYAGSGDVMLAISIAPYARSTIGVARYASRRGIDVVAITDSKESVVARLAQESVIVPAAPHSFFPSIASAVAAVEIIAASLVT
ncbi:MurR/RpiR family transcriptional regulator (plasmid) [Ensifer adhaerens]|uniref:MurR/RpiR family transcriptional regulator n=1 Tax=Ensifer adhaerens TaxID=106592 RepID=UPI00210143EC|nr:MurR/RpiR family transcriptional regulator [Ensifer adhaerens]UTV41898.1 MurR/RpiR family transcriptional regulator [Ensifer adhaerens]